MEPLCPPKPSFFGNRRPIAPLDQQLAASMRARIDGKAKPPGSLGRIEDLAVQLGMIRHPDEPRGDNAVLLVFAADHGLTEEGVSQYPSAVTVAMVMTYLAGRASANAFAAASDVAIRVIDAGVAAELPDHPASDRGKDPDGHGQCGARTGDDGPTGRRRAGARM